MESKNFVDYEILRIKSERQICLLPESFDSGFYKFNPDFELIIEKENERILGQKNSNYSILKK